MFRMNFFKKWASPVLSLVLLFSLAANLIPQSVIAQGNVSSPYETIVTGKDGRQLLETIPFVPAKLDGAPSASTGAPPGWTRAVWAWYDLRASASV